MKVRIVDRNPDGRGRGRLGRRAVLVSQAHPGEEVTLKVDKTTRGTLQGRVGRLLARDPERIAHACRHEFVCTGCPLLAADPEDEAAFKRSRVEDALAAADRGARETLGELLRPSGVFGYRHYAKRVAVWRRRRVELGSYVAATHEVADNYGCPVLAQDLSRFLDEVARRSSRRGLRVDRRPAEAGLRYVVARLSRATGEILATLVTSAQAAAGERRLADELVAELDAVSGVSVDVDSGQGNVLLGGEPVYRAGADHLTEELAGFRFRVGSRSFFQINPQAAEVLIERAVAAAGEGALCVEGYAGVGALTLPLAGRFDRVLAVESAPAAIADLVANAAAAGIATEGGGRGIEARAGRAEEVLPAWLAAERPSVAVLDPPRKGLGEKLAAALGRSSLSRIVLLSCDPATLGRDLPPLLAAGFGIERVTPIDPFPRTGHVETVSLLTRSS